MEEVELSGDATNRSQRTASSHREFIEALRQNLSIQSVTFRNLYLSEEVVAAFLDSTRSVTEFCISGCVIESVPPARDRDFAQTIAAALQRNQQILHWSLQNLDESLLLPLLRALASNEIAESFDFMTSEEHTVETSNAIQQILESSTTSIQKFELSKYYTDPFTEQTFRPITEGLRRSQTVNDVTFRGFNFTDTGARQVSNCIRTKLNLRSLTLSYCRCGAAGSALLQSVLREVLLRPDSSLRSLGFNGDHPIQLSITDFRTLLKAVEGSKLEELAIGRISESESAQHLRALLESLPAMKIKKFSLDVDFNNAVHYDWKPEILQALKRNFSLECTDISHFDAEDNEVVLFYLGRNHRLAEWIDNPLMVPRRLWPEAMQLALEAGATTLYQSLLALSGHAIGSMQGKRKRKRPRFYKPT